MSVAEALGARNVSRCLWQRHLEQEMLQDVSGRGTWSKICFKIVSARGTWSKKCFKMSLASKKCFKMSLATSVLT